MSLLWVRAVDRVTGAVVEQRSFDDGGEAVEALLELEVARPECAVSLLTALDLEPPRAVEDARDDAVG